MSKKIERNIEESLRLIDTNIQAPLQALNKMAETWYPTEDNQHAQATPSAPSAALFEDGAPSAPPAYLFENGLPSAPPAEIYSDAPPAYSAYETTSPLYSQQASTHNMLPSYALEDTSIRKNNVVHIGKFPESHSLVFLAPAITPTHDALEQINGFEKKLDHEFSICEQLSHTANAEDRYAKSELLEIELIHAKEFLKTWENFCAEQRQRFTLNISYHQSINAVTSAEDQTQFSQSQHALNRVAMAENALQHCREHIEHLDAWQSSNSRSGDGSWQLSPEQLAEIELALQTESDQQPSCQQALNSLVRNFFADMTQSQKNHIGKFTTWPERINNAQLELTTYAERTTRRLEHIQQIEQTLWRAANSKSTQISPEKLKNTSAKAEQLRRTLKTEQHQQYLLQTHIRAQNETLSVLAEHHSIGMNEEPLLRTQLQENATTLQDLQKSLEHIENSMARPRQPGDKLISRQEIAQIEAQLHLIHGHADTLKFRLNTLPASERQNLIDFRHYHTDLGKAVSNEQHWELSREVAQIEAHANCLSLKCKGIKGIFRVYEYASLHSLASFETSKKLPRTVMALLKKVQELSRGALSNRQLDTLQAKLNSYSGDNIQHALQTEQRFIEAEKRRLSLITANVQAIEAECGMNLSVKELQAPPLKLVKHKEHAENLVNLRRHCAFLHRTVNYFQRRLHTCSTIIQKKMQPLPTDKVAPVLQALTKASQAPSREQVVMSQPGLPVRLSPVGIKFTPKPKGGIKQGVAAKQYTENNIASTVRQIVMQVQQFGWVLKFGSQMTKILVPHVMLACAVAEAIGLMIDWASIPESKRQFRNSDKYRDLRDSERKYFAARGQDARTLATAAQSAVAASTDASAQAEQSEKAAFATPYRSMVQVH